MRVLTRHPRPVPGCFVQSGATRFVIWAPAARELSLVTGEGPDARRHAMQPEGDGYFGLTLADAPPGTLYRYLVDGEGPWPDPCSRYQPRGPHGPSMVVDTAAYDWRDRDWRGVRLRGQVIYELHVGAFTPEGTFDAAAEKLPMLVDLGVTLIELMPVAEFPGRFNWGYDGTHLFAPSRRYGDPQALMRFVDAAHALGLGVILDVVYNHLGPDGNYLPKFSPWYFTDRYGNEWGEALDFDGPHSHGVRSFFIENARYWIAEFHLDGLRLDATQSIHDSSPRHVLGEITAAARAAAAEAGRSIVICAENEPQEACGLVPVERGGHGFDAMWNDDFHHSVRVALTGRREGYFHDYLGTAQELLSAVKHGFLYQGQHYAWQRKRRGTPALGHPAAGFVVFTQNHDQVANTFYGERLHRLVTPALERAITAVLLLGPQTPLLFMGQEFAASSPFPFFADHVTGLREKVHEGRREFVSQFPSYAAAEARARILDPADPATFAAARLDWRERERNAHVVAMYRDLLALRRTDPVLARQDREAMDGAVLAEGCFVLRWFSRDDRDGDRLLVVNLGRDWNPGVAPEPLLAPQAGRDWRQAWCSDDPRYGGPGCAPVHEDGRWCVRGAQATFFVCDPAGNAHAR